MCHSPVKPVVMKKILLVLIIFAACKKEKEDTTPPVLSIPFVNTSLTERFIPFGETLSPTSINPAFEIILTDSNQQVVASCAGKINWIRLNDNRPDYEMEIVTSANSVYRIYYDHIENPVVSEGETIAAGDVLGTIGVGGRTELQINDTRSNKAICPAGFGTTAFITAFNTARTISNLNYSTTYTSVCLTETVDH
jgi:hypothetical protein